MDRVKVGIIGTGKIFPAYMQGMSEFLVLDVVACADIIPERAQQFAQEHNLKAMSVDELLADPDIAIVVNLTIPAAHAEIALKVIEAGKSVYNEKPLATTAADAKKILDAAAAKGVRIGCAPDTFLGGGLQTSRKLLDDGAIGTPVAAAAFVMSHGPESWHPNPDFFYKFGGGPLWDMGPYYLTALMTLFGPIKRIAASSKISFEERIATSQALNGHKIQVEVPTHNAGVLEFVSGPVASMIASFDVHAHSLLPRIEIYGSEGTLSVPDPNTFGGPVKVYTPSRDWEEIPLTHSDTVSRGIGVADMAYALRINREHRASGQQAYHVVEAMEAFYKSSETGQFVELTSLYERPASLPVGLKQGELDKS